MLFLVLWLASLAPVPAESRPPDANHAEAPIESGPIAPRERMACFLAAYPDVFCDKDRDGLKLCDGRRLAWDDGGPEKAYDDFLEHPDLEETVRMQYLPGEVFPVPPENFEPGRIRNLAFFEAVYGADRKSVERQLVTIPWMPRTPRDGPATVQVHQRAAEALRAVSDELDRELPLELRTIAAKSAGAYTWRNVRNSKRVSMHSFGIAIDVGVGKSDYWDWHPPGKDGKYRWRNRFPWAIAAVFERHGFVWGAKWYHFDTMHFEYRPELYVSPCVAR